MTGKLWKSKSISTSDTDQNYVAIPKQKWLDGINCGDGYIRQFVAMPLGKGYTVEVCNDNASSVSFTVRRI